MAEIGSAFLSIVPSAKGFGSKLNSEVGGSVRSSGSTLGKTFGKLFVLGAGVIAAAGIGDFLKGSIDEAREAQKVGAQTNAVLKSTGGVANVTAGQIGKLATALSKKIGVDDEAIQAGENMLLTFTNVRNEVGKGNDIFNQATRVVQDMAAAFGGDAVSNSKILGKALNDPLKGLSALTRVGVQFSAQQAEQIKALVASGKTMQAQKIILAELATQTKGSAEAQATAADRASVAWANLKEQIGTALLPVLDGMANLLANKIIPSVSSFITNLQSGGGSAGRFGDFIRGQVVPALQAFAAFVQSRVLPLLRQYVDFIITRVVPAFRDALVPWITRGKAAFDQIRQAVQDNKPELLQLYNAFLKFEVFLSTKLEPGIVKISSVILPVLAAQISNTIKVVGFLVRAFNTVHGALTAAFDGVSAVIQAVIDKVQALISAIKSIPHPSIPHIPGLSDIPGVPGRLAASSAFSPSGNGSFSPFHHSPTTSRADLDALADRIGAAVGREVNGAAANGYRRSRRRTVAA